MTFTKHAEQRMIERAVTRNEVLATLRGAKPSAVRESWKAPGTYLVFGANRLVVVVDRSANVMTVYREE